MGNPIQFAKTYDILNTESFFSFLCFIKKVGSYEIQKINVFSHNLYNHYIVQKYTIYSKNSKSKEELLKYPYILTYKTHANSETKYNW